MANDDKNGLLEKNAERLQNQFNEFANLKEEINPNRAATRIIIIYLVIGFLWILLSDTILNFLVSNANLVTRISVYKGWIYVIVTGIIFFFIIHSTLVLYKKATVSVLLSYQELTAAYEELTAMNEELDLNNSELEKQRNALEISDQRYHLAVEGANDGIWDWDIVTNCYIISEQWKRMLGYEPDDISDDINAWKPLFYPGDWDKAIGILNRYMDCKEGVYENTYRIYKKNGEFRWIQSRGKCVWDEDGKPLRIAGSHTDITEKKKLEETMETLAYHDSMTNLPNRMMFERNVIDMMKSGVNIALVNFDIDNLKNINDMYGQKAGDRYLKYIADVLRGIMKLPDMAARLNGNQFAVMYVDIKDEVDLSNRLENLLCNLRGSWYIEEQAVFGTSSIGAAIYPSHGTDVAALMQNAEIAMYYRKESGKDGYTIFQPFMYEQTLYNIKMNTDLHIAVEKEEFQLYYQPQIDLASGKLLAFEALIRWNHPKKGFIPPMEFIPLSEKSGHIIPISIWVMRTAAAQKKEWDSKGYPSVKMAVNMSGRVIADHDTVEKICAIVDEMKFNKGDIEIEVTETALMHNLEKATESLGIIQSHGISLAMDDFGTGYSSLTYLHKLPFDVLKIDREFIRNVKTVDEDSFIYKTVIELAHNMKLCVIAEGIETKEQREFLLKNHCDMGQGYYYAKPMPAKEIEEFFKWNS